MTTTDPSRTRAADAGAPEPRAALRDLPMQREPARDLWPAIEARIAGRVARPAIAVVPASRRRWLPLAAAASFVAGLAVLIAVHTGYLPGAVGREATPAAVTTVAATPAVAIAPVRSTAPRPEPPLPGWTQHASSWRRDNRALVKANLKMVTSAESQLRQAIHQDPQSPYLQRLLLTTQDQQRHLHRLLDTSRR